MNVIMRALRDGAWLGRERLIAYTRVLLALELATLVFFVLGTHGLIVPLKHPNTTDFVSFYAAGLQADQGHAADVYNHDHHYLAEEESIGVTGAGYVYFFYPPVYLLICQFLPHLPYLASFLVWEGLAGAAFLWVIRKILPAGRPLLPFVAFPALIFGAAIGQNALLTAALFGGGTLALERRPWLAGLLLGCLCYKPHFALLIPIALVAGGHGRAFLSAALTVASLIALSVLEYGADTWRAFLAVSHTTGSTFASGQVPYSGLVSPYAALRLLGVSNPVSLSLQGMIILVMIIAVAWTWRSHATYPAKAMMLISASLLCPPVILFYDLTLGLVALAWAWRDAARDGGASRFLPWEKALFGMFYFVSLMSRPLALQGHILLGPLAGVSLLAMAAARAKRWRHL